MKFLFIITIILILFLNLDSFNMPEKYNNQCVKLQETTKKNSEGFLEDSYPIGDGNHFNSNSRNNDYYYDRTGMKGSMFNTLNPDDIYESSETPIVPILSDVEIISKLEYYPEQIYNCTSYGTVSNQILPKTKYIHSFIPDFIDFNKGVIL